MPQSTHTPTPRDFRFRGYLIRVHAGRSAWSEVTTSSGRVLHRSYGSAGASAPRTVQQAKEAARRWINLEIARQGRARARAPMTPSEEREAERRRQSARKQGRDRLGRFGGR
jgi:hypothetical protein